MTEIKIYLTAEQRADMLKFYQTILTDEEGNERDFAYNSMDVRNDVIKLLVDTDSLITTIESQNVEYQKLLKIADDQDTKIGSLGAFINTQANQIETQKEEIERLQGLITSEIKWLRTNDFNFPAKSLEMRFLQEGDK